MTSRATADGDLAARISEHVHRLCAAGDRDLGTERNRAATTYASAVMRGLSLDVVELGFAVPEWRYGESSVSVGDALFTLHAGPYSAAAEVAGELVAVTQPADLERLNAQGKVLLLHGEIAHVQFAPRGYPFYDDPAHAAVLDALERTRALAVLAATGKNPSMTAGMSPFPLIEEPGFALPTAYLPEAQGAELAFHADDTVRVRIRSEVLSSTGVQPVGVRRGNTPDRIVVSAHIDSKPGTPGALDNASGVGVLLAAAELLAHAEVGPTVEFVPFNGEDHVLAPGELAYLGERGVDGVTLMVNIDGAGLPGAPSAYSHYNATPRVSEALARSARGNPSVAEGDQWPASDHMIFAMQHVPSVAITSQDFATASGVYAHTPLDTPDVLDYHLLAGTARFVADVVEAFGG